MGLNRFGMSFILVALLAFGGVALAVDDIFVVCPESFEEGVEAEVVISIADNAELLGPFGLELHFPAGSLTFVSVAKVDLTAGYMFMLGNQVDDHTIRVGAVPTVGGEIPAGSTGSVMVITVVPTCTTTPLALYTDAYTNGLIGFTDHPCEAPCLGGGEPTETPVPPTETPEDTPVPTETPVPPTETPEDTPVPTETPVSPTETPEDTPVPPTETPVEPTDTPIPPTETPEDTPVPTDTPVEPTETPIPPTETPEDTPVPPTETPVEPTETPIPPTETPVPTENSFIVTCPEIFEEGVETDIIISIANNTETIGPFGFEIHFPAGSLTYIDVDRGLLDPPETYMFLVGNQVDDHTIRVGGVPNPPDGNIPAGSSGSIAVIHVIPHCVESPLVITSGAYENGLVGFTGIDCEAPCMGGEPTETPIPPTETPVEPTDTPIPPTETPVEPTETPVEPTETPIPTENSFIVECPEVFEAGVETDIIISIANNTETIGPFGFEIHFPAGSLTYIDVDPGVLDPVPDTYMFLVGNQVDDHTIRVGGVPNPPDGNIPAGSSGSIAVIHVIPTCVESPLVITSGAYENGLVGFTGIDCEASCVGGEPTNTPIPPTETPIPPTFTPEPTATPSAPENQFIVECPGQFEEGVETQIVVSISNNVNPVGPFGFEIYFPAGSLTFVDVEPGVLDDTYEFLMGNQIDESTIRFAGVPQPEGFIPPGSAGSIAIINVIPSCVESPLVITSGAYENDLAGFTATDCEAPCVGEERTGDVNEDGLTTPRDAYWTLQIALSYPVPTGSNIFQADFCPPHGPPYIPPYLDVITLEDVYGILKEFLMFEDPCGYLP